MNHVLAIGPAQIILILLISLIGFSLTIIALVDILKSDFKGNNKIVWVLVVLMINVVGAVLYFLIGRGQKVKE